MTDSSSDGQLQKACRIFPDIFCRDPQEAKARNVKYYFAKVLGSGATGIVFLARRTSDGANFAVKVVDMEGMDEGDRTRAAAEVHCLLNCNFFSILKCHEDFIRKDERTDEVTMIALVLDYANAGDLRQEIKNRLKTNRPFKEHEAGLLFLQVLMAIHHVHSRHMIHRDIKSANILLCSNGLVKLGDFGFSKVYSKTVSDLVGKTFCGTPYYVAPEIWKRCAYSKKADMFSLGVLLYELLTLKRPFDGPQMADVMNKTLAGYYEPLPSTVSPEMALLVSSLLQQDPEKRPTSTTILNSSLCKLFASGLQEIVNTQLSFDPALRATLLEQIQATRSSVLPRKSIDTLCAPHQVTLAYEGHVKKQSSEGQWKKRFLCIRCDGKTNPPTVELILALSKDSLDQQAVVTPFPDIEDAFPVPSKYSGGNVDHVFACALTSGKRLSFQADNDEARDEWIAAIQSVLGIDNA